MGLRREIVTEIVRLCKATRRGRYDVRRGKVNWSRYPFERHPFAISVSMPEEDDSGTVVKSTLVITFVHRLPKALVEEFDDDMFEEMREDARWIGDQLRSAQRSGGGGPLLLDVTRQMTREISDVDRETQGIVANYALEY